MNDINEQLYLVSLELKAAKLQEAIAKQRRIAIEDQVAKLVPSDKLVGQVTKRFKDGSGITVKRDLIYKAELQEIENFFAPGVSERCGSHYLAPPVEEKTTRTLDIKGYEWYRENYPKIFTQIEKHVTVTPRKVSIELKPAKK